MKKIFGSIFAMALVMSAGTALAVELDPNANQPQPIITTGSSDGTYIKVGKNIKKLIGNKGTVVESVGSGENIDRIFEGKAQVGITQMDAYAARTTANPDIEDKVELMGKVYTECAYIAINPNGPIGDEDDLASENITIAIGKDGSGGNYTWDYLRILNKGYQKAKIVKKGGPRTLSKIASKPNGKIHAMLWVTKPNLEGELAQIVLNNENLEFMDLNDRRLNNKFKSTGEPIYRFQKIKSGKGMFGGSVETVCMDTSIIADADYSEKYLDKLAKLVLNYRTSLVPSK